MIGYGAVMVAKLGVKMVCNEIGCLKWCVARFGV